MRLSTAVAFGIMVQATSAVAQTTLGELHALKAVKTPKQVVEERMAGSKQDTTTPAGYAARLSYEAGGVAHSVVEIPTGARQFTGKWWAEDGKSCVQFGSNPASCVFWFTTDAGIFHSRSDAGPDVPVRKREDR